MLAALLADPNPLLTMGAVLVVGVLSGALAKRFHLPSVTGQILVGILLGSSVLDVFPSGSLSGLKPLTGFALGLMAVAVGSHLNGAGPPASTCTAALRGVDRAGSGLVACCRRCRCFMLGTLAVSTAPATILAIVGETRSRGVFVKTLVAGVALNNLACIVLFELAHTGALAALAAADSGGGASMAQVLLAPLETVGVAALLGVGAGVLLVALTKHVVRTSRLTTASLITILLTAGLAEQLGTSTLLSCLILGVVLANLTPDKEEIGHSVFENFESAIFAVFFTLAGLKVELGHMATAGAAALLMFSGRLVGKLAAGWMGMKLGGGTKRLRSWMGMALVPQAGLAVGLMLLVTEEKAFPEEVRNLFLAVVLTVVTLNEIVGPVLTRVALARSGDLGKDRARLIDFLHEENIVTRFEADSKEEAIRKLADVLEASNSLRMDREAFLEAVLAREAAASTCLGEGLAIPNAMVPELPTLVGAMGISRDGLPFETPDGHPVHCMVLLAIPADQMGRHLEVLTALARAATSDRGVQQQLYHAKSPAHAYEVLHAEESEDFNSFLED
ncbi:MAG: PTS sugar transporter subunit IIA [Planctomycetes bacterium]|nr:PTS sugar transporter subunit IIA [Planctomycetota bacterium]